MKNSATAEVSTSLSILTLGIQIQAILNLLKEKGLVTEEEFQNEIKKVENHPSIKDQLDMLKFSVKLGQIFDKEEKATEEDRKFIKEEGSKYYPEETVNELLESLDFKGNMSDIFGDSLFG